MHLFRTPRSKTTPLLAVLAAATIAHLAAPARAQEAPIGGHQGGRGADSGFGSGHATPSGGVSQSIALELPASRGELPVPVGVTYLGSSQVGAAGSGWDVPLSYVTRSDTFTRTRPKTGDDWPLATVDRVTVVLGGSAIAMGVHPTKAGVYRPFSGMMGMTLIESGDSWVLHDGAGRRYHFGRHPDSSDASTWLLDSITDSAETSRVELDYRVTAIDLDFDYGAADSRVDDEGVVAEEVLLTEVRYNFHPTSWCAKHTVALEYADPDAGPRVLAYQVANDLTRARTQVLRAVEVQVVAGDTCIADTRRLHRFELDYAPDPDTGLDRLSLVDVLGAEGTPEESTRLPVARYHYGRATTDTSDGRELVVVDAAAIPLPLDAPDGLGASTGPLWSSTSFTIRDYTGDGLADLVYAGSIVPNRAGAALDDPPRPLFSGTPSLPLEQSESWQSRHSFDGPFNITAVWVQSVDFNGDGRLDIVDARHDGKWVVHINRPIPGDPAGIDWLAVDVDIEHLRSALMGRAGDAKGIYVDRMPIAASVTGYVQRHDTCYVATPGGWEYVWWTECYGEWIDTEDPLDGIYRVGTPTTVVLHKLMDINGDGYPDIAANSERVGVFADGACHIPGTTHPGDVDASAVPPGTQRHCRNETYTGLEDRSDDATNGVRVYFNNAGVRIDRDVFANSIVLPGGESDCALEQWTTAQMECGIVEANGDGVPDRYHHGFAYLGTGERYAAPIRLPASPMGSTDDRGACDVTDPPDNYYSWQTSLLQDFTGDGIPDMLVRAGPKRYDLYVGDGTGWTYVDGGDPDWLPAPVAVERGPPTSLERCDSISSTTQVGLFDVDGDARPDWLSRDGDAIAVGRIMGPGGDLGALTAGRLTAVDNGYGATTHFEYSSAKADGFTRHGVPFAEIVLSRSYVTVAGDATAQLSRWFAYGGAELQYHPLIDAWVFPGYERALTVEGEVNPIHGGSIVGAAVITDAIPYDELPLGYPRYALAGRARTVSQLEGTMPIVPALLLAVDVATDARVTGQIEYQYDVVESATDTTPPGFPVPDCTDLDDPRDYAYSFMTGSVYRPLCNASGDVYPIVTTLWQGDDHPDISNRNVRLRQRVLEVDELARPLVVHHEGDLSTTDDDVCEILSYATSVGPSDADIQLGAVHTQRLARPSVGTSGTSGHQFADCSKPEAVIRGSRLAYDGLAEGFVSHGLPSATYVERYDLETGDLLENYRSSTTLYDAASNVTHAITYGGPGSSRTAIVEHAADGFALSPSAITVAATGVDVSLRTESAADPLFGAVTSITDPNGTTHNTYLDGFGRVIANAAVNPETGKEYVLSSVEYLGEEVGATKPLHVVHTEYHEALSYADYLAGAEPASATVTVTPMDTLRRPLYSETSLGADYAGEAIRTGETAYDALGRATFIADPYPVSEAGAIRYGTSYHYRPSGQLECSITGRGPQSPLPYTDGDAARFARCTYEHYENSRRIVRAFGANELDASSEHSGAYDESVETATGWVLTTKRVHGGAVVDRSDRELDRLGHLRRLRRYAQPASATGAVEWTMAYDSLGQLLRLHEPAAAVRAHAYDWSGNLVQTSWTDGTSQYRSVSEFDGLGRLTASYDSVDGDIVPDTYVAHTYDSAAADADHLYPDHLLGRLAYSQGGEQTVFYGYDGLGQVRATTFVGDEGKRYAQIYDYLSDGRLDAMQFALPDDYGTETVEFEYDSAQRVTAVSWSDEGGLTEQAFEATAIDPFGRYLDVTFGNGVGERFVYATGDRRELKHRFVMFDGGTHYTAFLGYDGDSRVEHRFDSRPSDLHWRDYSYDPLYRLSTSTRRELFTPATSEQFVYDGLGNLLSLHDDATGTTVEITPSTSDRDRICNVSRSSGLAKLAFAGKEKGLKGPAPCGYQYDPVGNVRQITEPARIRQFEYDQAHRVRLMSLGTSKTRFRYGPNGGVVAVDTAGASVENTRSDRRYGELIETSMFTDGGTSVREIERRVPTPVGVAMVRRGTGAGTTVLYNHGDHTGARAFTDSGGAVTQRVEYNAFGSVTSDTGSVGSRDYTKYQWNGGDHFGPFDLTHVGARLYEPATGRFLQRDPLLIPRTSSQSHPYAFAWSDPVNASDPSGFDPTHPASNGGQCSSPEVCNGGGSSGVTDDGYGTGQDNTPFYVPLLAQSQLKHQLATNKDLFGRPLTPRMRKTRLLQLNQLQGRIKYNIGWSGWERGLHYGDRAARWSQKFGRRLGEIGVGYLEQAAEFSRDPLGSTIDAASGLYHAVVNYEETYDAMVDATAVMIEGAANGDPEAVADGVHFVAAAVITKKLPAAGKAPRFAKLRGNLYKEVQKEAKRLKKAERLRSNKIRGDKFRDEVASYFESIGYEVRTEVQKRTPMGRRVIDVEVKDPRTGVCSGVECKVGRSRYMPHQRAKDFWLRYFKNYTVTVARER